MDNVENRREFQRKKLNSEISLHSEDNFYAGITGDISEGGIFVTTYTPPPIGSTVDIEIDLEGTHIEAKCEVRWVREFNPGFDNTAPGCGLRFVSIHPESVEAIRRFVSRRDTILFDDAA